MEAAATRADGGVVFCCATAAFLTSGGWWISLRGEMSVGVDAEENPNCVKTDFFKHCSIKRQNNFALRCREVVVVVVVGTPPAAAAAMLLGGENDRTAVETRRENHMGSSK